MPVIFMQNLVLFIPKQKEIRFKNSALAANRLIEGEGYILFTTAYFIDHVLACAFLPSKQSPVIFNPSVTRSYPFTPSWGDKYWYLPV